MQLNSASKPKEIERSPFIRVQRPDEAGWSYSPLMAMILSALVLFVVSTTAFYLAWDYMPGRIRHIPRYIESNFLPERPHDEFVAAPAVSVAPEDALQSLQLETVILSDPEPSAPAEPAAESQSPPDANAEPAPVEGVPPAAESAAADQASGAEGAPPVVEETTAPDEAASSAGVEAPVDAPPAEPSVEESAPPAAAEAVEPAPPAAPLYQTALPAAVLEGVRHEYQGWNNCGPATLAMNLSFFGRQETQNQTAPFLKPDEDDKNVSPGEMVAYAHSIGFGGQVIVGADLELLRTLVTNRIPVIVESWYIPEPNDEMGHYLLLRGYEGDTLHFYDSYGGPNVQKNAAEFDALWKVFNRTAVVIWPQEQVPLATAILGDRLDQRQMYERALATAHAEVNTNPQDKFAWFNLGTNLTALGDSANAVKAFDTARSLQLPWRMLWYQFAPFEAYYNVGNYQEVINLATATLNGAGNLEESFYWRGRAYAALGQNDAARNDFQQAVRFNANFAPAHEALATLAQ